MAPLWTRLRFRLVCLGARHLVVDADRLADGRHPSNSGHPTGAGGTGDCIRHRRVLPQVASAD